MVYKYCLVPGCQSTTVRTPEKHFFSLPVDKKRRSRWIFAMRRSPKDISIKSRAVYVCQDHFKLEDDLENYVRFQLKGGSIHLLKPDVVPHIFDCQPDRHLAHSSKRRLSSEKRERQEIIKSLEKSQPSPNDLTPDEETSFGEQPLQTTYSEEQTSCAKFQVAATPEKIAAKGLCLLASTQRKLFKEEPPTSTHIDAHTQWDYSEFKVNKSTQCNIKIAVTKEPSLSTETPTPSSSSPSISTPNGSWKVSSEDSEELRDLTNYLPLKATIQLCRSKPKRYLGIPEDCMGLIPILCRETKSEETKIFFVFQKIKLNQSFGELGDHYGWSEGQSSKIFSTLLIQLSTILNKFIVWPTPVQISLNLPIAFRENFSKVQSVIDCFEVQIEQPSDPLKQSLSWSNYKRCNTMKYLISSTPNGMVNFISVGYGGRISDSKLLKKCGYLQKIPRGSWVMADRGFKGAAQMLEAIGCHLVRPPSVAAGEKLTKAQVHETRRIASLRIHIERVIRRLREFAILKPHDGLNNKLIKYLDHIVVTACSLCNMQSSLIRK